ncbi:unnamed protein product, partial [Symbiodinium pilosum]
MKMLTVKDIYTHFIGAYPVDTRSEINVRNSLKVFMGDRKIKLLYGDNAEEFEKAADTLEIPFDNSVPNRKQTNAIVERTSSMLLEFALRCYTLLHNTEKVNGVTFITLKELRAMATFMLTMMDTMSNSTSLANVTG